MSRKKERPTYGTGITPEMSVRDRAAALGISTGEMYRWGQLANLPEAEFESRLAEQLKELEAGERARISAESILNGNLSRRRDRLPRVGPSRCPKCGCELS